jgi:acyl-CoA synthetase (AMP-forming)/AMP-acid ligase II
MGGECFDSNIWEKLAEFFPNARCKNIYASTEAGTLFSSLNGDVWRIPDHLRGKVKVSDESELLVHYSLIGNLHVDSNLIEGEWFRTGDLIAPVDEASFRIAGRASDQINVGGFKVDPIEVETVIRQIEFVKDCRVYARRNSVTGSLICADVLLLEPTSAAEKETAVKERMKAVLQAWKIPRIINFVAEISKTTSGKVKRT